MLAHHVFDEPDPAAGVDEEADAYSVEGSACQVNAVPTGRRFVDHAFLYVVDASPGCWIGTGQANAFAAIAHTVETFVLDPCTLIEAAGAGVAESTVDHVPGMLACAG